MAEYSTEAAAIAERHIDEIDEDNFDGALWEALEKNLLTELLDIFEKAGIHITQETIDIMKEKYRKYLEISSTEKTNR